MAGKRTQKKGHKSDFTQAMIKLSKLRPNQRIAAVKMANNKFVRQFCNSVNNLRKTKLPIHVVNKLHNKSASLRKLVSKKTGIKAKKDVLTQRGGFLGFLLPILIKSVLSRV